MIKKEKYELGFWGTLGKSYKFPRYRRIHDTYESAEDTAYRVLKSLEKWGVRAAHPAIILGPGCGRDGKTIL